MEEKAIRPLVFTGYEKNHIYYRIGLRDQL